MPATSSCRCDSRNYLHAHCYCHIYNCGGKAVSRSTYQHHRKAADSANRESQTRAGNNEGERGANDNNHPGQLRGFDGDTPSVENPDSDSSDENPEENPPNSSQETFQEFREQGMQTDEEEWDQKIVDAFLNALPLKHQQGDSIKSFEGWLKWAKDYVLTEQKMKDIWPTTWSETEDILRRVGYESPKHYYICMSKEHAREWDIMESPSDKCKHCGEPGDIDYYYMGLSSKIKRWYGNPDMCSAMLDHWREKEHWFNNFERGQTKGWPIKKELWDGVRFSQYSWFFDKEVECLLPTTCPHCKNLKKTTIISESKIASFDVLEDNTVNVVCPCCRNVFNHSPVYKNGDPRNIVYIAHWDGFSPFGTSGGHSTGVIDVKIGNLCKNKRNHSDQVFVVGFVPCFKLPDETPEFLDPFLSPLMNEIVDGFIDGIEVEYCADFPDFDIQSGPAVIRHLILLWTGDHPGQCEVAKVKRTGKKACRRCHICGIPLEPGSPHYYYGNCRYHARHKWASKNMEESLPHMKDADEEVGAAWSRISRDSGFTGVSMLTILYDLYGFDVLLDTPVDLMHNLPMNPVKKNLRRFFDTGNVNKNLIEARLENFPWTAEMRASRYPSGITSRLGYWKAEDYQKFCFPASEVILNDLMDAKEFQCWTLLVQMIQMVFNCCRLNGWREEDIELFNNAAWRHNIMVEETFGLAACVITEHNLIHVSDDIYRFSSPDNYWVFDLERAIKRYVNQSTNHRNIEKTYSDNETRREVLQNLDILRKSRNAPSLTQEEVDMAISVKQVSSLKKGYDLIAHTSKNNLPNFQDGILIGGQNKRFHEISETQRHEIYEDIHSREEELEHFTLHISSTTTCKSILKPGTEPSGLHVLYRKGENVIYSSNGEETTGRINNIHSVIIEDDGDNKGVHLFVEVQEYENVTDDDGETEYHSGTQSVYLQLTSTIKMVNTIYVLRKVILYPEQANPHQYVLIDFQMPSLPQHKQFVVVPFYPEKNDMILILGQDDYQWIAIVVSVQEDEKKVGVHFFKEHPRWPEGKKYIKESSTLHSVHWDCIIKELQGQWMANGVWELQSTL